MVGVRLNKPLLYLHIRTHASRKRDYQQAVVVFSGLPRSIECPHQSDPYHHSFETSVNLFMLWRKRMIQFFKMASWLLTCWKKLCFSWDGFHKEKDPATNGKQNNNHINSRTNCFRSAIYFQQKKTYIKKKRNPASAWQNPWHQNWKYYTLVKAQPTEHPKQKKGYYGII